MMIKSLYVASIDAKTLLGLIPAVLGYFFFYRIKSSKMEHSDQVIEGVRVEYPPLAPIGIIQWLRARLKRDYPVQTLQWCRQIDSPVYLIKTLKMQTVVHTNDCHFVRQVLKDKGTTKPTTYKVLQDAFHNGGDDVLTSDGLFWKHSRKSISPAFSPNHLKRMTETVKSKTEDFIKDRLDPMAEKGESIDVCKEMIDLTLSIISEAAFEYEISDDEKETFIKGIAVTLAEATKCIAYPLRSRFGRYILPEAKEAHLAAMRLLELGTTILQSYRATDNPTKGTVIDQIARNTSYKTDKERVSDILILLFAGHDTTGLSTSWILLELAKKPHEQHLLRKELRGRPKEDRSSLAMLRNVVKEGMRLQPVAPIQARVIDKDIIYKREGHSKDFLIPKGSDVTCNNFLLCRNEKYFKDPDDFIPSRWEDASDDAIAAVMPFSLGRRNCVGQSLAILQLHCVIACLCSAYEFSVEEEGVPMFNITWKPDGARLLAKKVK